MKLGSIAAMAAVALALAGLAACGPSVSQRIEEATDSASSAEEEASAAKAKAEELEDTVEELTARVEELETKAED